MSKSMKELAEEELTQLLGPFQFPATKNTNSKMLVWSNGPIHAALQLDSPSAMGTCLLWLPTTESIPGVGAEVYASGRSRHSNLGRSPQLAAARDASKVTVDSPAKLEAVIGWMRKRLEGPGSIPPTTLPPVKEVSVNLADESIPGSLPTSDERLKAFAMITLRPEQSMFRESLRRLYGDGCQMSGCPLMEIVQACHIIPHSESGGFRDDNGILLRVDLHILFDSGLLGIDPDRLLIRVSQKLANTEYADLAGVMLRVGERSPSRTALRERWKMFIP